MEILQKVDSFLDNLSKTCNIRRAERIVRIYYALSLLVILQTLLSWKFFEHFDPLWPLFWTLNPTYSSVLTFVLATGGAIFALFYWKNVIFRLFAFFGILLLASLLSSFGKINHDLHFFIYVSFLLIFFSPDKSRVCALFLTIQAVILSIYTISGFQKLIGLVTPVLGMTSDAFAQIVANRIIQTGSSPLLARMFIENFRLLGNILLIIAIMIEVTSLLIIFKQHLVRVWGALLIAMHIFIYLVLSVNFLWVLVILFLFLVYTPFEYKTHVKSFKKSKIKK